MGPLSLAMWLSLFGLAMSKPAHPHKPNSYIVTLRREVGDDDKFSFENVGQKMKNKAGKAKLKKNFGIGRFKAILVEDEDDDDIRQLLELPEVEAVEPNELLQADTCVSEVVGADNWALARLAGRSVLPYPFITEEFDYKCEEAVYDVYVYVLDTGIRLGHAEFEGRASWGYTAPLTAASDIAAGLPENDDNNGHGTHVAGIVAGKTYGVAKYANVVAVKTLDHLGRAWSSDIIEAIEWVVNDAKAKNRKALANASLGAAAVVTSVNNAVKSAVEEGGVPFVVSAGNHNIDACNCSPAGMGGNRSSVITVAATNKYDIMSYFSNYGPCVDVMAPGEGIRAAINYDDIATEVKSGTSMAAPVVSGIAARHIAKFGNTNPATLKAKIQRKASSDMIDCSLKPDGAVGTPNLLSYYRCS